MDVVVERCAGLDVHRDNVVATVRVPGDGRRRWAQQTQTFRATLAGLAELGDWLSGFAVTLVGMEATGVHQDPLHLAPPSDHALPAAAEATVAALHARASGLVPRGSRAG